MKPGQRCTRPAVVAGMKARTMRGGRSLIVDVLRHVGGVINTYYVRDVETGKRFVRHRDALKPVVAVDIETTGSPFEPTTAAVFPVPKGRVLSKDLDEALAEAHKICTEHIHCGVVFGARMHNPLERAVAAALVAAYYNGKKSGGR